MPWLMEAVLSHMAVRPMLEDDLDAVLAIESRSFPHPWTRDHFLHEIRSPLSFPAVAVAPGGDIAGYVCAMVVAGDGEILDVAVDPSSRGKGVGRVLMEEALRLCREKGAERVLLEVRVSNAPAIRMYETGGFRATGIRRRYYENGEDALLMEYVFATGG